MALSDLEVTGDDDFRCAPWTAAQGVDAIGSATRMDRLVTVEVPGPWPRDVAELPWLADVPTPANTRLHAVLAEAARPDGSVLVTRWQRMGARFVGAEWSVSATAVPDLLVVAAAGADPGLDAEFPDAELLVCAHGRRDRCCGSFGTRLAVEARAALAPHRVRRISHLGGHRYAPTALSMPDGRFWGFLDVPMTVGIVERTATAAEAREFYRGNSALDPWAQTVEATLLRDRGWHGLDIDELRAESDVAPDGASASVTLAVTADGVTEVVHATVEVAEHYPVLQCGLPPEEATKTAAAYQIRGEVTIASR